MKLLHELKWEAFEDRDPEYAGCWRVEASDTEGDGDCYVTIFSGPAARERAIDYAEWMSRT